MFHSLRFALCSLLAMVGYCLEQPSQDDERVLIFHHTLYLAASLPLTLYVRHSNFAALLSSSYHHQSQYFLPVRGVFQSRLHIRIIRNQLMMDKTTV